MLTYGSVCSGIEAATVAWPRWGFRRSGTPRSSASLRPYWPIVTPIHPTSAT